MLHTRFLNFLVRDFLCIEPSAEPEQKRSFESQVSDSYKRVATRYVRGNILAQKKLLIRGDQTLEQLEEYRKQRSARLLKKTERLQ